MFNLQFAWWWLQPSLLPHMAGFVSPHKQECFLCLLMFETQVPFICLQPAIQIKLIPICANDPKWFCCAKVWSMVLIAMKRAQQDRHQWELWLQLTCELSLTGLKFSNLLWFVIPPLQKEPKKVSSFSQLLPYAAHFYPGISCTAFEDSFWHGTVKWTPLQSVHCTCLTCASYHYHCNWNFSLFILQNIQWCFVKS
jgi:hypothetical protein